MKNISQDLLAQPDQGEVVPKRHNVKMHLLKKLVQPQLIMKNVFGQAQIVDYQSVQIILVPL